SSGAVEEAGSERVRDIVGSSGSETKRDTPWNRIRTVTGSPAASSALRHAVQERTLGGAEAPRPAVVDLAQEALDLLAVELVERRAADALPAGQRHAVAHDPRVTRVRRHLLLERATGCAPPPVPPLQEDEPERETAEVREVGGAGRARGVDPRVERAED